MDKAIPAVPFEKKTKKYGTVTVLEIKPTSSGGLVLIDDGDHLPSWVRAKSALGEEFFS